ncbi:MAG: DUF2244 domain-containing protein [Proteobacteria bacterium]|nr:DUF2244 domain-containing protein [Pseudomonadota bacterium]MBS0574513.1 DUF2244 domain-containing protein [Pseudomonadota bacterium]
MPYQWTTDPRAPEQSGALVLGRRTLRLWPNRSLTAGGFVAFFAASAFLLALPMLALVGTAALWVVFGFAALALGCLWLAISRSNRALGVTETLTLTEDRIVLDRRDPGGRIRSWAANPYWVRVSLDPDGGPVPDYLTLTGDGREVELGAFLSPDERRALAGELRALLPAHA